MISRWLWLHFYISSSLISLTRITKNAGLIRILRNKKETNLSSFVKRCAGQCEFHSEVLIQKGDAMQCGIWFPWNLCSKNGLGRRRGDFMVGVHTFWRVEVNNLWFWWVISMVYGWYRVFKRFLKSESKVKIFYL